jgi:signal transduction histidine kinase
LRGLLERTAVEIAKTLKGEQAIFFINTTEGHFVAAGTDGHKHIPKVDVDQLAGVATGKTGVIIASLLEDSDLVKRMMISHRIELVLPLIQDNKTLGYLFLGDHLTSNYTNRDIKVLNTISNELVIAIQNALAVQEIREFNITLQQRIANATRELRASNAQLRHLDKAKDEFLSMASHQLRTPLTSVKGYISMIMDGDVGKVSTDQKKLLGEAFNNSERMVGLINDFLSVSRIQTGRFVIDKVPIDLSLVVEQEVDSLRANAGARQMELVYDKPTDCPIMDIDESKIRQVIMNFIDNAIYYSHPNTKININLVVDKGEILFTVKDTGIGVPKSERDQLFTKFYRASNAKKTRPDGTGVGLFLAKKVVDGHDGDVIFDSVEGKGSTFGFKLPIKPLVAASNANDLKN